MRIFNARDKEYKSKISAIATDEKVKFRIIVARDIRCSGARLVVTKEGETPVYYGMFWAGMCGDYDEYWELHFYATTPGLYFYHFELDTPWGVHFIRNAGNGSGEFLPDGPEFQQTVYDKNFHVPDFLKGGLIYQIFPDRFYNSGEEKKNVPHERVMRKWGEEPYWDEQQMNGVWNNDYFGGDLKGIEEKLPYIASLGVTAIYLNPIFEAHTNHRYDTGDYEKIDCLLGTEDDLKSLCAQAKKLGIGIILDGVFSHTGCDSKYFNLYGHYPNPGAYNSTESPYYSWYKFGADRNDYRAWWGIKLLPEVREEDPSYRRYICGENGILRRWMRCGISGWRLDVADELPDIFLDDLRRTVKDENPDAVIIGEVWEDATNKFAYGQRRRYLLGDQLDSVMNYPFASAILRFVRYGDGNAFVRSVMSIVENYPPQVLNILMNHIGTHDTMRAITALAGEDCSGRGRRWQHDHNIMPKDAYERGVSLLKLASLIQYMLPGVPSLYYGDEAGMQGMKDPFNRGCMPWGSENKELLKWYRRLGEIRKGCKMLADGEFVPLYADYDTVCFERRSEKGRMLVCVNRAGAEKKVNVDSVWNNAYPFFDSVCRDGVLTVKPLDCALFMCD